MDAAAARERRKARLRNGADRLQKITGKPVDPATLPKRQEAAAPAPAATPAPKAVTPVINDSDDPPDVFPEETFDRAFSSAVSHDNEIANAGLDPNQLFTMDSGSKFGQKISTNEKTKTTRKLHWPLLHFISMILVGLYACWNEYKLWKLFMGVELALVMARYALDPALEPSILRTLLQFVPANISAKLSMPLFGVQALRNAYYDFCIVLFVWASTSALY